MMFECLGTPKDDPRLVTAKAAIRKLLVMNAGPFLLPALRLAGVGYRPGAHALIEAGGDAAQAAVRRGPRLAGDETGVDVSPATGRRGGRTRGRAAGRSNTPIRIIPMSTIPLSVAMALDRFDRTGYGEAIARAAEWITGMQSRNGGWGAFDADNNYYYLNYIPFADHGALLDPPTADVSARCVGFLGQIEAQNKAVFARGVAYLLREQEPDGSWFGRWGTNYIYGTWSALCALRRAGLKRDAPAIRRAVAWLLSKQRADGGWGEDGRSYWATEPRGESKESTASQTAWAMLALMAAGEYAHPAVARGARYLMTTQRPHGLWDEDAYTAVGFPRVFYLRYHGYRAYFPLWALARYRNVGRGAQTQLWGI